MVLPRTKKIFFKLRSAVFSNNLQM